MPSPKRPGDPDFKPFEYRPGIGVGQWRGVVTQASAAFPDEDQLRDAINIRVAGHSLTCRGGQALGATTQVSGSLDGIWEASDID